MKQGEIVLGCKSLDKILGLDIPFSLKAKVYRFRKLFQTQWEFQLEQEQDIMDKAEHDESGKLEPQEVRKINKKLFELSNTEVDMQFDKLVIETSEDTEALKALNGDDFKALDEFVEWR